MRQHLYAILAKFVMVTLVLFLILSLIYGVDFYSVLVLSVILTLAAYFLGDLMILPAMANRASRTMGANAVATVADFGLALIVIWFVGRYFISANVPWFTAAIICAVIIALGEMLFHRYLRGRVIDDNRTV